MSNKNIAIDGDTGEIIYGAVILTPEMQKEIKRKKREKDIYNSQFKEYGSFYWLFYEVRKDLFNKKIEGATISRLMYLATYMAYEDNILYNKDKTPIKKSELGKILNLKEDTARKFINECIEKELILFKEDGKISISNEYFKKGKFYKEDYTGDKSIIRVYCEGICKLYENCKDASQHKSLSYLFLLIPYANRSYNIICRNPMEEKKSRIKFLNMDEICDIVGYSRKNKIRLKNEMKELEINGRVAFRWLEDKYGSRAFINPAVYYAGNKHSDVYILGQF